TLGWPEQTADLRKYYPTTLLITGFDIIFFWVARMIVMGLEFTGDVPFRQVYIHGLVRDAERQKMSKTRGNVIDPLVVTPQYGTDAVRLALLLGAAPGTDIVISGERMQSARAFANKIWNAARFLFLNMERCGVANWTAEDLAAFRPEGGARAPVEDRWIFSRLNDCAGQVNRAIEQYRYHEVAQSLWHFFWHEFCDWYVEIKKLRFQDNSGLNADWRNLLAAFETALRLLHPAMPFLTEELWQRLGDPPRRPLSIALASYPAFRPELADPAADEEMRLVQEIVTAARNLRADLKLDPKQPLEGGVWLRRPAPLPEAIQKLANVKLEFHTGSGPAPGPGVRSTHDFDLVLRVPGSQAGAQRTRLEKEREQLDKVIASSRRQLSDETFLGKAPAKVVDSIRAKLAGYEAQLDKVRSSLEGL
ncbi:MAG: class I tRNA ligase family protein, partial [Bryobacteraceae bacterium]